MLEEENLLGREPFMHTKASIAMWKNFSFPGSASLDESTSLLVLAAVAAVDEGDDVVFFFPTSLEPSLGICQTTRKICAAQKIATVHPALVSLLSTRSPI